MTDVVIIVMLLMRRQLLDPYMGPSLLINVAILATCAVSLSRRHLFYAPLVVRRCDCAIHLDSKSTYTRSSCRW